MTDYKLVPVEQLKDWHERINTIAADTAFDVADEMEAMLSAAPTVQGEPVAWLRFRSHRVAADDVIEGLEICEPGETGDDGGPAFPVYATPQPAPAVQMEVVGWQYYQHGKWWGGDSLTKDQRKNIEEKGIRVRDVYAATQPTEQKSALDAAQLVEALEACRNELLWMIERHNQQDQNDGSWLYDHQTVAEANAALAAHRKGAES